MTDNRMKTSTHGNRIAETSTQEKIGCLRLDRRIFLGEWLSFELT